MVSLGYGKFVKADRVYALVPIESGERGDGRRTYVHVDGLERAARRLALRAGDPGRRRGGADRGGRRPAPPAPRPAEGPGEPLLKPRRNDLHVLLRHRPRSIPQAQESA